MASGLAFATVGTTKFDSLVFNITRDDALKALKKRGYRRLRIQIGNGTTLPDEGNGEKTGIEIEYYRFKKSIEDDIADADLVVSHAGAGSCLEVLEKEKPLLVVINEELMHNHQTELAQQLSSDGFLYFCTVRTLAETISKMDFSKLKKYPKSDPHLFPEYLNKFMGFLKDERQSATDSEELIPSRKIRTRKDGRPHQRSEGDFRRTIQSGVILPFQRWKNSAQFSNAVD